MVTFISILGIAIFLTSCKPAMDDVISYETIKIIDGKEITITGIYKKMPLNQRKENNDWSGKYAIQVNDSLAILLEQPHSGESNRPKDEVKKMEDKMVSVKGVLSLISYLEKPSIESTPLTVSIPCIHEIKSIELE